MANLGALRTGFSTVFVGRVYGRRRWDLCIQEFFDAGESAPAGSYVFPERDLRLYYGKSNADLWSGALASSLRLRVYDPASALFARLEAARIAGEDDSKFRAILQSADGLYKWEGWLRLDTTDRAITEKGGRQITEVFCYDGQADISNLRVFDILASKESAHSSFRNILSYSIAPLSIRYLNEFSATNLTGSEVMNRIWYQWLQGQSSTIPPAETLTELLKAHLFRSWQGLGGLWWVAQPWLLGRDLAIGEGGERYEYNDYNAGSFDDLTEVQGEAVESGAFTLREPMFNKAGRRGIYKVISRLAFDRNSPRAGRFDQNEFHQSYTFLSSLWDGDTYRYGIQNSQISFDNRGQFSSSMRFDHPAVGETGRWYLERQVFDEGEEIYFSLQFVWMAERLLGSGDVQHAFEIRVEAIEPGDSDYYLTSTGEWTVTPTTLTTSAETPDANGSPTLTEHTTTVDSIEPIPVKGRLVFDFLGEATLKNDLLYLTRLWVFGLDSGGNALEQPRWKTTYRRLDAAGEPIGGETESRTLRAMNLSGQVSVGNHIEVYNSTSAGFEELSRFLLLSDPGNSFSDITDLHRLIMLSEDTARLRRLTAEIRGIFPPEWVPVWDCVPYVWLDGYIDLIPEITSARWAEKPQPSFDL